MRHETEVAFGAQKSADGEAHSPFAWQTPPSQPFGAVACPGTWHTPPGHSETTAHDAPLLGPS